MRKNIDNLLLISFIFPIWTIFTLNGDLIPIHFNILGKVDRYGNKFELLIMPILFVVVFIIIKMIKRYVVKDHYPLFDFITFELLLFLDFIFFIICFNLFFIVNLKYDKFVIDLFYSCSWFLTYLIFHLGIKTKNLSKTIGSKKTFLLSFFYLSIFIFLFAIFINVLFVNKPIAIFIILLIYMISVFVYFVFILQRNKS